MIKSRYADQSIDGHGFVNHISHVIVDLGVYPGTVDRLVECYKIELLQNIGATSGTGGKPRNLALFRKALGPGEDPRANVWHMVKMWQEGIDYDDAAAAGSVAVDLLTGQIHVVMSFGKKNAAGAMTYQPWEASVARNTFAPAVVRLPTSVGTPDSEIAARIAALEHLVAQQANALVAIETALANVGSGTGTGLSTPQVEALRRMVAFFGL